MLPIEIGEASMAKERVIAMPFDAEMASNLDNYRKVGVEPLVKFLWVIHNSKLVDEIRMRNKRSKNLNSRSDYTAFTVETVAECYGVSSVGLIAEDFTSSWLFHDICEDKFDVEFAKEGYTPNSVKDPTLKAIFCFIIPILTPDKPRRIAGKLVAMIVTAYEKGKPVNWAQVLLDLFQLCCRKVKDGIDLFLAPMLFHLYRFEGKLSNQELQFYEEEEANRALKDDLSSNDERSETEDEDVQPLLVKVEEKSKSGRVLRERIQPS